MKRLCGLALLLLAVGCQASNVDKDISGSISDPKLKAQIQDEYKTRQIALAAMETHCRSKWGGDPAMVAYCEETQTPVLRRYVSNQVQYKHMNKGGLFNRQYASYIGCRAAHPGDFEMAQACVDNNTALRQYRRMVD
jgi:hypothetical protein